MSPRDAYGRGGSKRRLRLRVTLLAAVEYVATCSFLFIYWLIGRADGGVVLGLFAYSFLANFLILLAIASGWSERLKDPSMTAFQMAVSCGRDLTGCYVLPGLWFIFAFNLFIALPFGSLQFTNKAFAWFWLLTCACLGLIFLHYPDTLQIGFTGRTDKGLLWLFLTAALARLMLFNSRISELRRKLRSNAAALAQASRRAERERVAKELHETVLQTFFGLVFRLTALTERLPAGSVERAAFEAALSDGEQALVQGRDKVFGWANRGAADWSLVQALRQAGEDLSHDTALVFQFEICGDERSLTCEAREAIEAIVLQALTNAFRHSDGRAVRLDLDFSPEAFTASVHDDGRGMDSNVVEGESAGQFGLHIMRERADSLGAVLSMAAQLPGGTQVSLRIPARRAYDVRSPRPIWWHRFRQRRDSASDGPPANLEK